MNDQIGVSAAELRQIHAQQVVAPPDVRPYRAQSAGGPEMSPRTDQRVHFRQVGWQGQSGAFYSLDEDPSRFERGSFSPLYIQIGD